mgnify:CR=1 FL=1
MCYMKGCLDRGYWSPLISISPDGIQWAHMRFGHLLMCDHHKDYIDLNDLIAGPVSSGMSGWSHIQASFAMAGKQVPEREFAHLKWELA